MDIFLLGVDSIDRIMNRWNGRWLRRLICDQERNRTKVLSGISMMTEGGGPREYECRGGVEEILSKR